MGAAGGRPTGLGAVAEAGLAYDLLVRPRELSAALETARRNPGLRFAIDHIATPEHTDRSNLTE